VREEREVKTHYLIFEKQDF